VSDGAIGVAGTTETTEAIVQAATTGEVVTGEEVVDSMTDEQATAIRVHPLPGLATTDIETLLQRVEQLTATSQAALTETILPPAGAARLPTTAPAADPSPPLLGATAATPPVSHPCAPRILVRPADTATTGQPHAMFPIVKTKAKARASVVTKAADPVRVLLLTDVAHDHPDAIANPTLLAAEGRPRTTADHLPPISAAAEPRRQYLAHRLAGAAMHQCRVRVRVRLEGVAKGAMIRNFCRLLIDMTSVGLAQVMQAEARVVAVAAVAARAVLYHLQRMARSPHLGDSYASGTTCRYTPTVGNY
jgi:hypothetical protein